MMDNRSLRQKENRNSPVNKQKTSNTISSLDEMKKEHKPDYVNIYWDEWR